MKWNNGEAPVPDSLREFDCLTNTLAERISKKCVPIHYGMHLVFFLLGLGILSFVFYVKYKPYDLVLALPEFITMILISAVSIFSAIYLQLYQYKTQREIFRALTDTCARIVEKRAETDVRIREKAAEADRQQQERLIREPIVEKMLNQARGGANIEVKRGPESISIA